jgi:hypothetical protein
MSASGGAGCAISPSLAPAHTAPADNERAPPTRLWHRFCNRKKRAQSVRGHRAAKGEAAMRKLMMILLVLLAAAVVLLWSAAVFGAKDVAPAGGRGDFRQEIELIPLLWQPSEAEGFAFIEERGELQRFGVNIKANVEDGTTYVVVVSTAQRRYVVGTITMYFGSGELREDYGGPARVLAAMPPVRRIQGVFIHDMDREQCAMEGYFQPAEERSVRLAR